MKSDHIVMNAESGCLECKNCGDVYEVQMPVPLLIFIDIMKSYRKIHIRCKK